MTRRWVFVTTELAPDMPGGAGAVVAELAARLAAGGTPATVVIVTDEDPPRAPGGVDLVHARPGAPDDEAPTPFLARARAAALSLADLAAGGDLLAVEVVDFDGLAFWALAHRQDLGLSRVPMLVRFHGPVDAMAHAMGVEHAEWAVVRVMERAALSMADGVIVPSAAIGAVVRDRYAIDEERLRIGQPPIPPLPAAVPRTPMSPPEVVALGRLGEVKGSHDLVDAVLAVRETGVDLRCRFVGGEGWSIEGAEPMAAWLTRRIPDRHVEAFRFDPPVSRAELPRVLATASAVVVASRFESFCLAAHEARLLGHPVILPDLPAFDGVLVDGVRRYDGSVAGLADALRQVADDPASLERLAAAPRPPAPDPLTPYRGDLPSPRHERVQAGAATAAVKGLEAALEAVHPAAPRSRVAGVASALLRGLPDPVARIAIRLAPQGTKDRFRALASWPAEQERRAAQARRAVIDERIAAGEYPELEEPDISVVIPCYDQGPFLADAIRSVFEQSFSSWEIIVVDDGSRDAQTRRILDDLDLPRVRLIRQSNTGLPGARNAGMRAAAGRFLVPLDADDELAPDFMTRLHSALCASPAAAYAQCWAELFGEQSAVWVPRPWNAYQLLLSNSVVGCVLLRRAAWEEVGGYAEDMVHGNEDWDLWLRVLAAGWDQVTVAEPLFRYRKHGVSMSVETEARFEQARAAMPQRHQQLYAPERVRALKAEHYPWMTLLDDRGVLAEVPDDAEVVTDVAAARGKVLIDVRGTSRAGPADAVALARALEEHPSAYAAVPEGGRGPCAVRRWSVVDPRAEPDRVVQIPLDVDGDPCEPERWRGAQPEAAWMVDPARIPPELALRRQRPEEDGPIPAWLVAAWREGGL